MSAPHQTDRMLWDAVLAGDGDSFGALFERHRDRVFRHAWRLVDDATDAEDLTAIDTRLDGEPATTALSHAITSLPRIDRDLLTLTALEGFTLHQASEILGLTYGAAKTRMSRTRRKLGTAVSASLTGPPAPSTTKGAPS